jgi:caa(3)-type oxidase subunit IV
MSHSHDHGVQHGHEHHTGHAHEEHHGPTMQVYMVVAIALAVFTAVSFVVNNLVRGGSLTSQMGFLIILGVAVCKTGLVGGFFMHLKYEWGKLYFMIVPAFILGAMMMIVLLPDQVLAWHHDIEPAVPARPER